MLYDRIEALCKEKHMSIAKLERKCELGNATIRGWKYSDPRASYLKKVADELGVTVDSLLKE